MIRRAVPVCQHEIFTPVVVQIGDGDCRRGGCLGQDARVRQHRPEAFPVVELGGLARGGAEDQVEGAVIVGVCDGRRKDVGAAERLDRPVAQPARDG